mgnify:FL=1
MSLILLKHFSETAVFFWNIVKHIKDSELGADCCRLCKGQREKIQNIALFCSFLTQKEYQVRQTTHVNDVT